MNYNNISSGENIPNDINVIIEISSHSNPIKYEINKKYGILFVDRFITTPMFYPCNYGYINNTLSLDDDPLDVVVITKYSIIPGTVIRCRPIGILNMIDESGDDKKIIAVPHNKISQEYLLINKIQDLPKLLQQQIMYFFQHYKDLENEKWCKTKSWGNLLQAQTEILSSIKRFKQKKD
ncbi:inorganic diphosphatase [Enterobacteriaceae endosymbiont of Donacia cincticornis]|uniref:inorganic diphosphatase n=1 Tax=Enterobacteriaceae endosymbiont of Donacia cincticornis TaxID=2675773 RepID=UPI001449A6BA|nr:inorganic diphosphatase [Enterobacteriaceae endosymbiont of Donacia cincticornis]QJC36292.1 inorganic diphosphatase [Enterobacteriaceae endosymbiont of Donacia cincticornis]